MVDDKPEWIPTAKAAEIIGVDPATVWRWATAGMIVAQKVGRSWNISRVDAERIAAERQADKGE